MLQTEQRDRITTEIRMGVMALRQGCSPDAVARLNANSLRARRAEAWGYEGNLAEVWLVFFVGGGFFFQLAGDVGPDGVAGFGAGVFAAGFEEALGLLGDGFEIADEGGAVGMGFEEVGEARDPC